MSTVLGTHVFILNGHKLEMNRLINTISWFDKAGEYISFLLN